MRGMRSLLLLAIALSSVVLLLSNRSLLALRVLTLTSLPLPLGLWLLLALLTGALTTVTIRLLVSLLGTFPSGSRAPQDPARGGGGGWFGRRSEAADWTLKGRRGTSRPAAAARGADSEVWDETEWQGSGRTDESRAKGDRRPPVVDANYRVVSDPGSSASSQTGRSPAADPKASAAPPDDWSDVGEEDW